MPKSRKNLLSSLFLIAVNRGGHRESGKKSTFFLFLLKKAKTENTREILRLLLFRKKPSKAII